MTFTFITTFISIWMFIDCLFLAVLRYIAYDALTARTRPPI